MNIDYMKQNYDFKDYLIGEYFVEIDNKSIKLPRFQRDIVWTQSQIDELANSLKLGIPFGTFLLAGEKPRILLDGLQRTYALRQIYERPQKFFNKDQIDNSTLEQIKQLLLENDAVIPNNQDDEIQKAIVEWIRKSLDIDTYEFKGLYLAKYLFDQFSVKESAENLTDGDKILSSVIEVVTKEKRNIAQIKIPCVIYKGSENNLPLIFEKLNSKGTSLTKYQIFAANWVYATLPNMKDKSIKKEIFKIYQQRLEQGDISINNLPEEESGFLKEDLNLFEYLLGLGNVCENKFPELFAKKGNTIGFTLSAACLQESIRRIYKIDEIINDSFNFEKFQTALFDSIKIVYDELRPYISVLIKRSKGKTDPKPIIFHSDYQIISLISKVFREKYDSSTFDVKREWNKDHKWIDNIPYHYLFDQLEDNWRGSGDSRIEEMLNTDYYKRQISRSTWKNLLNKWFEEKELSKQQRARVSIDNVELLFLNYIYSHTITIAEADKEIFNLEHLVPVQLLTRYINEYNIPLPISAISNICYLDANINKKKGSKTIYEFLKENPEEPNIHDIESKYTFTKEADLDFISFLDETNIWGWNSLYEEFLSKRFEIMVDKFLELNKIKE